MHGVSGPCPGTIRAVLADCTPLTERSKTKTSKPTNPKPNYKTGFGKVNLHTQAEYGAKHGSFVKFRPQLRLRHRFDSNPAIHFEI